MRKVFIVLASLSSITALVLTYLPMGTIALIPVALAVVFSLLAMRREKEKSQVFPKVLFFLSVVIFLTIIAKDVFVEDKIVDDQQFIQEKQESVQDAKILLEGLDSVR
jgi:ABC-type polysaccharide transport system permease subunit